MTPEEELKQLNKLIRQFESVYRSTTDPDQKDRVVAELKKLKTYRDKVATFHVVDDLELEEEVSKDELEDLPFLKKINGELDHKLKMDQFRDREVYHLAIYLYAFEHEFLALLSETKLKLHFKYSIERDGFYHRFAKIRRLMDDFLEDTAQIGQYEGSLEEDWRNRRFKKKRNVSLDADRFFRSLAGFAGNLIDDIEEEGMMCLNAQEILRFDRKLEGKKMIDGLTVQVALEQCCLFSKEISTFLNVPQIEPLGEADGAD